MQSLICQAGDCTHNVHGQCSANVIQVNNTAQETFCDTYAKDSSFVAAEIDEKLENIKSSPDMEFGNEFVGSPKISCNVAQCAYNKSFHCQAEHVEIDDPHDAMICNCLTYRPK